MGGEVYTRPSFYKPTKTKTMSVDSATGEINGIPFKTIKDGYGTEHKVIDLDKPGFLKREGSVLIEAVQKTNKKKGAPTQFKMCRDKATGILIGICTGVNPRTKELDWLGIQVGHGTMFNLEIKDDAEKAAVVTRSTIIEGSPNQSEYYKLALFRVHDEMIAAVNTIRKIDDAQKAVSIASGLYGPALKDMARNLGIDTRYTNETILFAAVKNRAYENPSEFLRIAENPDLESITIFKKALGMAVITHDPLTGYKFRDRAIGINENYVCEFFRNNPDVKTSISMLAEEKTKATASSNAPKAAIVDPEKEALKREIAELKAQKIKEIEVKADQTAGFNSLDDELYYWQQKALEVGGVIAQGYKNYKPFRESIDKLKEKVLSAQQLTT